MFNTEKVKTVSYKYHPNKLVTKYSTYNGRTVGKLTPELPAAYLSTASGYRLPVLQLALEAGKLVRCVMVDKGVGALPRPQVCSVPVQTAAATVRVGVAVPKFVFGMPKT